MTTYIVLGAGALVLIVITMLYSKSSTLSKAVSKTIETKDISHVLEVIDKYPLDEQPTHFNSAIKPIWDSYERELACKLIKELLKRKSITPIAQHWLEQVAAVEPEIARKEFSEEFLKEHYHAEVAAACRAGCASC
ncbi:MAG: hypothetical protein WC966_10305 [Bradymonadales bacterium]|jgi:hypothetical protein